VKAINWSRVEAPEENKKQERAAGKIVPTSNIQFKKKDIKENM